MFFFCSFLFLNQSLSAVILPDRSKRELLCGHSRENRSKRASSIFFLLRFYQYDEKEAYENFKQFYEDTLPEFRKAGTVVQFKVTVVLFTRQCFGKNTVMYIKCSKICGNSFALRCN